MALDPKTAIIELVGDVVSSVGNIISGAQANKGKKLDADIVYQNQLLLQSAQYNNKFTFEEQTEANQNFRTVVFAMFGLMGIIAIAIAIKES